ncbi:MAG TPA: RNB domain-containing ribonuclease [Miltoncostaeaceae bacterium]|nr:RNB domain-containing ribonuclease [Miltoncostaeaceae bacterium]
MRLGSRARADARPGDLVTVEIGRGGARVVAVHGRVGSARAAMAALLESEGLGRPFSEAALAEAEAAVDASLEVDPERRDLTGQRVITIDPEGAKDHDDAVSVVAEGEAIRLWVHIADVARYVAQGGPIDREALRRGCSVYVPGTVDPMLPERLSSDICSLRPGVDRKVVTVEMLVDARGTVLERRFSRALVHSRRRLTYPEVDAALAGGGDLADPALEADLRLAHELAERLRRRRLRRGALEIATTEPAFTFSGAHVAGVRMEGQTPAHSLVEECMIAANEAVARHMLARSRPTVYRYHPDPQERPVELLYERLEALEVRVPPLPDGPLTPTDCAAAVRRAAQAVSRHVARSGHGRAVVTLVLQALGQAVYSADLVGHSGLASAAYLHFTSPIRRYPDLVAHRALLDTLGLGEPGPDAATCAEAAERSSLAERAAAALERRADRIALAHLLVDRLRDADGDRAFDGEATGIGDGGLFAAFGPDGPEPYDGYLPARRIGEDWWRPDPLGVALVADGSGRRIAIGDPVAVRVVDVDRLRGRVDLEPADAPATRPARRAGRARGRR